MFKIFTVGVLALLLSACGSMTTRVALEPAVKQKLSEVKVLSVLPQDEVIVRAESFGASVALGGGLIGAMIDSKVAESRQGTLQEIMAPFYASVDNYDFRTDFERTLGLALANNPTMKFSPVERTTLIPMQPDFAARMASLKADNGQMFVRTNYTFTSDFTRLNVISYVELRILGNDTPVFRNSFFYQSKSAGAGGADSVKIWSNQMGEAYRSTMNEATSEIVKMLQLDLAAGANDTSSLAKATIARVDGAAKVNISGSVLAQSADRKILRDAEGNVHSLPQ